MYKREKCFIETKKQHVSFVGWHFSLTPQGKDLWATYCMNHLCSGKHKFSCIHSHNSLESGAQFTYLENLAQGHCLSHSRRKPYADELFIYNRDLKASPLPQPAKR